MSKITKATAIYGIVSGIIMPVFWVIFAKYNLLWKIDFFISAMLVIGTAVFLVIGGVGVLRSRHWGSKLLAGAMGSLLVQVVVDFDHFLNLNMIPLTLFFAAISLATFVFLILSVFDTNQGEK